VNQKKIDAVLTEYFWPPNLTNQTYITTHDDHDGEPTSGMLSVVFSCDGDAWIKTYGRHSLRFRTLGGGGQFPKIRNALLLLADAIRQEGQDPTEKPSQGEKK